MEEEESGGLSLANAETYEVDENGNMIRIVRFTETTHSVLEDSVRAVFKKWKMTEPKKNGQRVKAVVEQPIKF